MSLKAYALTVRAKCHVSYPMRVHHYRYSRDHLSMDANAGKTREKVYRSGCRSYKRCKVLKIRGRLLGNGHRGC